MQLQYKYKNEILHNYSTFTHFEVSKESSYLTMKGFH